MCICSSSIGETLSVEFKPDKTTSEGSLCIPTLLLFSFFLSRERVGSASCRLASLPGQAGQPCVTEGHSLNNVEWRVHLRRCHNVLHRWVLCVLYCFHTTFPHAYRAPITSSFVQKKEDSKANATFNKLVLSIKDSPPLSFSFTLMWKTNISFFNVCMNQGINVFLFRKIVLQ